MNRVECASSINTYTFQLSSSVALRIYAGTRPHNWKTAALQKGLIVVHDGVEVVGEGMGFGAPVVVYSDETYFSSNSRVHSCEQRGTMVVRKEFDMDTVARNSLWNMTLESHKARTLLRNLDELYQRHKRLQSLALKRLSTKMSIETNFIKTGSVGKIAVDYFISKERIRINAHFGLLKNEKVRKIVMLNEQGSKIFRRYTDSEGAELVDRDLGAWSIVNAQWACMTDQDGKLGFRLNRIDNALLRVGREFLEGTLDWAGLDYEVNSKALEFEYNVEMLGSELLT